MLKLPKFDYLAPEDLSSALELFKNPATLPLAGGTDLLPKMKRRQIEAKILVGLTKLSELKAIFPDQDGNLVIGSLVSLSELLRYPELKNYRTLQIALQLIANPTIRNMGTLGGNLCLDTRCFYYDQTEFWRNSLDGCLKKDGSECKVAPGGKRCWAISSGDTQPALIALDAKIKLKSYNSERVIPLQELYRDDGINYLNKKREELIISVILPKEDGIESTFVKLRPRWVIDFTSLSIAMVLKRNSQGVVKKAKIVLGGVASCPLVLDTNTLIEEKLEEKLITKYVALTADQVRVLDTADFSPLYRKQMLAVLLKRTLSSFLKI